MHIYVHIFMYMYIYVHIYTYTYIYAHICTCMHIVFANTYQIWTGHLTDVPDYKQSDLQMLIHWHTNTYKRETKILFEHKKNLVKTFSSSSLVLLRLGFELGSTTSATSVLTSRSTEFHEYKLRKR